MAVRSHECNVVLRFLAGYPIRPRRRCGYKGLRVVIAPPQARSHVSRAPPEGLDWSSTREGFSRRAIGRPPQAFEPALNKVRITCYPSYLSRGAARLVRSQPLTHPESEVQPCALLLLAAPAPRTHSACESVACERLATRACGPYFVHILCEGPARRRHHRSE